MKVTFKKINPANHSLTIIRQDKSTDEVTLHTETYFLHDICHFVVENELKLQNGFWGMLAQGYGIAQLAGKTNELTAELRLIEHVVGGVQSMFWRHMTEDVFWQAMRNKNYTINDPDFLNSVISKIQEIMNRWKYLPVGEVVELEFKS